MSAESDPPPDCGSKEPPASVPALLVALLSVRREDRGAWLVEHAPARLHAELLALAERADQEGTLEQTGAGLTGVGDLEDAQQRIGRVVGNYRLVELIGEGGMGAVYLAQRQGDYQHEAAIKLARPALVSQRVLDRLAQERQILADLEHPNIARLLDGGSTEQGEVYLVLERVEGSAITDFCWQRELAHEQILRLFLKVCDAVTAAHRALLVHGDLKPSNILVREDGEPKLLDFGVARTLSAPQGEGQDAELGWTPGFASPEQLRGQRIGVASDVYSLGVLLHLLLARRLPGRRSAADSGAAHDLPERPATEAESTLAERPATNESTRSQLRATSATASAPAHHELAQELPHELAAVLGRCLASDPEQRYASVSDLSADLERSLQGMPVDAVGGGRWYVARKFAQRHRLAVLASALAAVVLLVSWGVALQQARVARERAVQSELERQRADRTNQFLYEIFNSANTEAQGTLGIEVKVVDALERAGERLWADDTLLPEDRASFAVTLADLHQNLDQDEAARRLLQRLVPFVEQHTEVSPITRARVLRITAHMRAIEFDFQAALPLFEQALDVLVRQYGAGSDDFEVLDLELALRAESVTIFWNLNRCDDALRMVQPVLDLRGGLRAMPPDEARRLSDNLGGAMSNLASCRWSEGRFEKAFELSAEALQLTEEFQPALSEQLAVMHNNSGFYAISLQEWSVARGHLQRAVEVSSQLGAHELKNGIRLVMLARAEANLGDLVAAREYLEEGLAIAREVYAPSPRLWTALARSAEAAWAIGEIDQSISLFEEAIAGAAEADPDGSRLAEHRGRLALLLRAQRPQDARIEELLEAATAPGRLESTSRERQIRDELTEVLRDVRAARPLAL